MAYPTSEFKVLFGRDQSVGINHGGREKFDQTGHEAAAGRLPIFERIVMSKADNRPCPNYGKIAKSVIN